MRKEKNDYTIFNGDDLQYLVNKDTGVVICKLLSCEDIVYARIWKYTFYETCSIPNFDIKNTYVGVAKCHPEDTFDEKFGKKLALDRAKAKRKKAINRALQKYIDEKRRELEILEKYGIHD